MNARRRPREHQKDDPYTERAGAVPAVLPQILLEAVASDTLIVTINGDRHAATSISRGAIAKTLTELVAQFGSPTRVEVRELDGSIHADILTPPAPPSPFAPPADAPATVTPPRLLEFAAEGFVPGEDVALALILRHASAGPGGVARALVDLGEKPAVTGEVILLGRISGTTSVQHID